MTGAMADRPQYMTGGYEMKGYKAFSKGLICKDKQYAENTTFEEKGGAICGAGMMHFCENPFDCLDYYPLIDDNGDFSEFAEVEALEEAVTDDKKKYATKKLHIGAKLDLKGFINAGIDFLYEKTIKDMPESNIDTGDCAKIGSSGYYAQIGSSGDSAQIKLEGIDSVAAAIGIGSRIKAKKGNWITLAEWSYEENAGRYVLLCVKSALVDGETLKEDVWYMLQDGEFKECE